MSVAGLCWNVRACLVFAFLAIIGAVAASGSAAKDDTASPTDETAVIAVLKEYKQTIERLDASGTERLFLPDAQIFEQGGREGSYQNYLAHHLAPELREFASFRFDNYEVSVRVESAIAVASESYTYRITLKKGGELIERKGVATSVLKRTVDGWRFLQTHSSSRKPPAPASEPAK